MKIITQILILTILFLGCNSKNEKKNEVIEMIEIKEELEWNKLEVFINQFAKTKPKLEVGKDTIIKFVKENFPSVKSEFLLELDIVKTQKEFINWVKVPLLNSPPDKEIVAFYFGLFASDDPQLSETGEVITVLYLAGSKISPEEDSLDWAVEPEYFPPERYCVLDFYTKIDEELSKYKNTTDLEQILFNGITNLILINSIDELKSFTQERVIYVGSGFDSGSCFLIEKIE